MREYEGVQRCTEVYRGVQPKVFTETGIRNSVQVSPTCNTVGVSRTVMPNINSSWHVHSLINTSQGYAETDT